MSIKCPVCGAPEAEANTPRTVYLCGSSDYDQRPGTFKRHCWKPAREKLTVAVVKRLRNLLRSN